MTDVPEFTLCRIITQSPQCDSNTEGKNGTYFFSQKCISIWKAMENVMEVIDHSFKLEDSMPHFRVRGMARCAPARVSFILSAPCWDSFAVVILYILP